MKSTLTHVVHKTEQSTKSYSTKINTAESTESTTHRDQDTTFSIPSDEHLTQIKTDTEYTTYPVRDTTSGITSKEHLSSQPPMDIG